MDMREDLRSSPQSVWSRSNLRSRTGLQTAPFSSSHLHFLNPLSNQSMKLPFLLIAALLGAQFSLHAANPEVFDLWPSKAPGEIKQLPPEGDTSTEDSRKAAGKSVIRLGNVSNPQIAIYRPGAGKNSETAVIIAPGGGYNILAYDLEGSEVAEWLNSIGVTAVLLKYRVPRRHPEQHMKWKAGVQDTQRAVSIVRSRAAEFGIDPNKIGLMGFSAGAHASGMTTLLNSRQYPWVDGHDQHSYKPNFVGLIYLGYNLHDEPGVEFSPDLPPFFMAVTQDDANRGILCAQLFIELKQVDVPSELHIYESGGHGYGLRPTGKPVTGWNHDMAAWMKQIGVIK